MVMLDLLRKNVSFVAGRQHLMRIEAYLRILCPISSLLLSSKIWRLTLAFLLY